MFTYLPAISVLLVLGAEKTPAERVWTDASGEYTAQAALVDFDKETVVLKKPSGRLIALPIAKLSKADQEFLQSQNAAEVCKSHCAGNRTWVLRDGSKLAGRVVSYAPKRFIIQRRFGKILVNDKPYRDLPKDAQHVVRKFVEHNEKVPVPDDKALEKWATGLRGESQSFELEGVVLKSENGEMFAISRVSTQVPDETQGQFGPSRLASSGREWTSPQKSPGICRPCGTWYAFKDE